MNKLNQNKISIFVKNKPPRLSQKKKKKKKSNNPHAI